MLFFIEQQAKTNRCKVPQTYMQILEWCIAVNTITGFERLHKFIEEEKCLLGHFSVIVTMASLKVLLVWRCKGLLGQRLACSVIHNVSQTSVPDSQTGCWSVRTLSPVGQFWVYECEGTW